MRIHILRADGRPLQLIDNIPHTGHPSAVRRIHCADGTTIDDLTRVRDIVYKLQRPAISSNRGLRSRQVTLTEQSHLVGLKSTNHRMQHTAVDNDLVLFNNRGVLHSVVGAFQPDEVRLFRQCNLAASVGSPFKVRLFLYLRPVKTSMDNLLRSKTKSTHAQIASL
jgi:hypothetical protein